jgi:prevent-host-death family protein
MKRIPLNEVKNDVSRVLHLAEKEEIIITRHGKPAGVLIGFESEDDWFEYRLLNDPDFQAKIERSRADYKAGRVTKLEDIKD